MKLLLVCVLVAAAVASVDCLPKKGDNKKCNLSCAANYDPVCAQDKTSPGSKPRTFGNKCVMDSHNCEHKASMQILHEGECKGSGGVRIS